MWYNTAIEYLTEISNTELSVGEVKGGVAVSMEISVRCPYCSYEGTEYVDALAEKEKQSQRLRVICKACGRQFTVEAKATVRLRVLSKDAPPKRTLKNTIRNETWCQEVLKYALMGMTAAEIREQLITDRFPTPCDKTLKSYIMRGEIPGINGPQYLAAVEKSEQERQREDTPTKRQWKRIVQEKLTVGWELEEICNELRRKGLSPASKTSIRNRIESGYFLGITINTYQRAVTNRRKRQKRQWGITVRTMMEQGYTLSKIHEELSKNRLSPNSLGALSAALRDGKIPGMTPEKYQEVQNTRKALQSERWVQIVQEMLDAKAALPDIQARLREENLSPYGARAIVQEIKNGAVPGHVWAAPGDAEWASLVFDLMLHGMTLKAIEESLQENGASPYSRTTVADRLKGGQIRRKLDDGTWDVMTLERYKGLKISSRPHIVTGETAS